MRRGASSRSRTMRSSRRWKSTPTTTPPASTPTPPDSAADSTSHVDVSLHAYGMLGAAPAHGAALSSAACGLVCHDISRAHSESTHPMVGVSMLHPHADSPVCRSIDSDMLMPIRFFDIEGNGLASGTASHNTLPGSGLQQGFCCLQLWTDSLGGYDDGVKLANSGVWAATSDVHCMCARRLALSQLGCFAPRRDTLQLMQQRSSSMLQQVSWRQSAAEKTTCVMWYSGLQGHYTSSDRERHEVDVGGVQINDLGLRKEWESEC